MARQPSPWKVAGDSEISLRNSRNEGKNGDGLHFQLKMEKNFIPSELDRVGALISLLRIKQELLNS